MMGETQHVYTTSDVQSSAQEKDLAFEQFNKKDVGEFDAQLLDSSEGYLHVVHKNENHSPSVKVKEHQNQREAVIRPQQAGKIDFKSLHNRPKFLSSDGPWGAVKGTPQSPTGKSRTRDKNRRSGKGERGQQQLYRLTISNARPNPTIGIAYPQQKVTPPKKVDVGRGSILGSYRFHVPSIPEREVELQQEDLGFVRGFPENASSHISSNFTSPAATARPNHGVKITTPVGAPHENSGTNGQLRYLEFQGDGNNSWPSADKSLPSANNGLPAPKGCPFPEGNKSSMQCLGPLSFPYPFQPLHSSTADSFQGDLHAQDYIDVPLGSSQTSLGAFAVHPSSRDWKDESLGNSSYDPMVPESSRVFSVAVPPATFIASQAQGHLPCYKGRNEPSSDHNGALSPTGAIDPNASTFQENQGVFPLSLRVSSIPKPIGKRQPFSKDHVANSQRILDQGGALRRNVPHVALPQVHFHNKAYSDSPAGGISPDSVPFEKSLPTSLQAHPRLLQQPWEGPKKIYSPVEQSLATYSSPVGSQFSFGCHSGPEQRPHIKKSWQPVRLASATSSQNRIELSRKLALQNLPFPLGTSDWEGNDKGQKGSTSYSGKVLLAGEGAVFQRHEPASQNGTPANAFCFSGARDAEATAVCTPRSKSVFFGVSPVVSSAPSRLPSKPALMLPPHTLAASPTESPLPSPAPNPTSSSTCSSLSPMSSSPSSHSFEDGLALTPSPFFHHQCHQKDGSKPFHTSEMLCSSETHYPTAEAIKAFHFSQGGSKDEALPLDDHFYKPSMDTPKGCLEALDPELPPPPYSSHHLLASSLSSASLDQLDVFLTCKQCDQNFSNLSSFLEHRQFCSSHVALQSPAKDFSRGLETQKHHHQPTPESLKQPQVGVGLLMPQDSHLLALNKTIDFVADGDSKGDCKEDSLKANQLSSLAVNPLPLTASDLEIDDAKLDSLITEALNRLGYQSDNPEIDSSFIDVFADEELASVKVTNGGTTFKAKESLPPEKKMKHAGMEDSLKVLRCYDDHLSRDLPKSKTPSWKQHDHKERRASWFPDHGEDRLQIQNSVQPSENKMFDPIAYAGAKVDSSSQLKVGQKTCSPSIFLAKQVTKTTSDAKLYQNMNHSTSPSDELKATGTPGKAGNSMLSAKDAKKQKLRSGTWSKELIHKIVQQKNKFHKLHTKSSKAIPLSLHANRLQPEMTDSRFGEYEYMSESDDERVEYAKRHSRRKLASRFNSGRLRSSLRRRRQGRGGCEKEKESAWRYSQRRERQEPKRGLDKEPGKKNEGIARSRRRSSQSSMSSFQSPSLSSESSNSPQSTEGRADSDTEKEGEQRRENTQPSKHARAIPREFLATSEKERIGKRSHKTASDVSRDPNQVDSTKVQPAIFKADQRNSPNIFPGPYRNESKGSVQSNGEGTPHEIPTVFFEAEESKHSSGSSDQKSDKPATPAGDPECCTLEVNLPWTQLSTYNKEVLKYHVEEFGALPSVDTCAISHAKSPSSEQAEIKCLKKQKEIVALIGCFRDGAINAGNAVGERGDAINTFYECVDLSNHYESSGVFSGTPPIEASHGHNVYLGQGSMDISSFKQKPPEMSSYSGDHEQNKVSSPLSFDSSSVFGELPGTEFDATLYDAMALSKDSYTTLECAGHQLSKMIPFEQQFSSFLQEKDWNLMEEVSPVLPEELAHFHTLPVEKRIPKRFSGEEHQMPERIADFNVSFASGLSDDELEIKRLVTELESQLQASKLHIEASGDMQATKCHPSTEKKEGTHSFSPLTLNQGNEGKDLFLVETDTEDAGLLPTKICACENSGNDKNLLAMLDNKYKDHREPWPYPVAFSPLHSSSEHVPPAVDLIGVDSSNTKDHQNKLHENLKDVDIGRDGGFQETAKVPGNILPDSCLSHASNSIEVQNYADHFMQSSDPLFPKILEASQLATPRADVFPELSPKQEKADSNAELGLYDSQDLILETKFGLQDVEPLESDGNLPPGDQSTDNPEERLTDSTTLPEIMESKEPSPRTEDGVTLQEEVRKDEGRTHGPISSLHNKDVDGEALAFEMSFPKRLDRESGHPLHPQEKADNPLQQLQLFVARTVKNNEEDLLTPSFPALHQNTPLSASIDSELEQEEESLNGVENEGLAKIPLVKEKKDSLIEGSESITKSSNPTEWFLEPGHLAAPLSKQVSCSVGQVVHPNPEQSSPLRGEKQKQKRQLKDQCCTESVKFHHSADGIFQEHCPLSNAMVTSLLREEGAQGGQARREVENNQQKATLVFRKHHKSPLIPESFENETQGSALPAMLKGHAGCATSQDETCCEPQMLSTAKCHQKENAMVGQLQGNMSLDPSIPSEKSYQDSSGLLHGVNSSLANAPDPMEVQNLQKPSNDCREATQNSIFDQKEEQKIVKEYGTPSEASSGALHNPTGEKTQHISLLASRPTSGTEKTRTRNSMENSLEDKEWNDPLPFPHAIQNNVSPPPSGVIDSTKQSLEDKPSCNLIETANDVLPQLSSSHCLSDVTASLVEAEKPLKLQTSSGSSCGLPLFKDKDHSENQLQHPAYDNMAMCSVRAIIPISQAASPESILLGQFPSETSSALLADERTDERTKVQKEVESHPMKGSRNQTQPGILSKDAEVQEMSAGSLSQEIHADEVNIRLDQLPKIPQDGSNNTLEGIDRRGKIMESEGPGRNEEMEGISTCLSQAESKGRHLRAGSKVEQEKEKEKKLQATCDICSVSFKSKTGLMRHKTVKHHKKRERDPLPDPNFIPPDKTLKTNKQVNRRGRKTSLKENAWSSHALKSAAGQPFPRSYKGQRKKPRTEKQEAANKVSPDLSVSGEITHVFQGINSPGNEMKAKTVISEVERPDASMDRSEKVVNVGEKITEDGTDGSDHLARKKSKGKAQKIKLGQNQNKSSRLPQLDNVCSDLISSTISLAQNTISEEVEHASSSTKPNTGGAKLPPPPQMVLKAEARERSFLVQEVAQVLSLQNGRSCKEQKEKPESVPQYLQDSWASGYTKQIEKGLNNVGEEQDNETGMKEPGSHETPLEERIIRDPESPLISTQSPELPQQSCNSGTTEKGHTEAISEKTLSSAFHPVDSKPSKIEVLEPRDESHNGGTLDPDLQNLFDDDSTFSQLFPRNDPFARRKCTRVYGKRTKKLKPVSEVKAKPENSLNLFTIRMASDLEEPSSFCVTKEDPCEYDTISIDDALMLNMCHSSKAMMSDASPESPQNAILQSEVKERKEAADMENDKSITFLGQEPSTEALPCLNSWDDLEKTIERAPLQETLLEPPVELARGNSAMEASPEPPDLEEENYGTRMSENPDSPSFHTIDVEMLNPKFEVRDVCFFNIDEDHLDHTDNMDALGTKPSATLQNRPAKNKLEEGKQGKNRSDLNLKIKDKQYKCKVCFQWFLTLGELDFHKLTHNPSPPPTCYMCVQRKFSSREQLRDHLKEKHTRNKAGLWACGMCLKEISDVWMYNEHLREHATQFARKGQAQKSVLGLPGCFSEEDAAVTHFLNSIMCRKPSKLDKQVEPGSKESRSPKEPPAQEGMATKDSLEISLRTKLPGASPKAMTVPSPEPVPKAEGAQKLAPMHPECKDPSRDCHHCGKQFPKPFKLQRHLVVHSLQKIYLCHKCPMFYQETKELRSHLSQEHGIAKETEIKHTILYTCELCADVMHVIKKSFICSTCNYTFSKKEQYDRHMEKHLVGSSKTFRFRGVMRPGSFAKDGDKKPKEGVPSRENLPAAKKKKLAHPSSTLATGTPRQADCSQVSQQGGKTLLIPKEPLPLEANIAKTRAADNSLKGESLVGNASTLLGEISKYPLDDPPPSPPLLPQDKRSGSELGNLVTLSARPLAKGDSLGENLSPSSDAPDRVSIDLASLAHEQPEALQKLSPLPLSEKHCKKVDVALNSEEEHISEAWGSPHFREDPLDKIAQLPAEGLEATGSPGSPRAQESSNSYLNEMAPPESATKLRVSETVPHAVPLKVKSSSPAINRSTKEIPSKKATSVQDQSEDILVTCCTQGSAGDIAKSHSIKDKVFPETVPACHKGNGFRETGGNRIKSGSGHVHSEALATQTKHGPSDPGKGQDRPALHTFHNRRRKELKCFHKGSPASRENIEADGAKKKKARMPDAMKSDSTGGLRKSDWPNDDTLMLSHRRRDMHCNKRNRKLKVPATGGQLKKMVLDACLQKKVEIRHGDFKCKRDMLGSKTFHSLLAKDPFPSLPPSSFKRQRAVQGTKLPETQIYRTAESQNNLLSQLFGQKLTSFKIPLRRDTSE